MGMRKQILTGTDIAVSRFTFGTGTLFKMGTARQRKDLLAAAYDHGFSHFDTAPYYGFGSSERDLKPVLASHADVTVTTKVGIYSPGGESQPELAIFLRKVAGRLVQAMSRPHVDWSVARARRTLDASIRRLGRERIDLYMLHEPDLTLVNCDEWLRWLEDERLHGRIRHFGISFNARHIAQFKSAPAAMATLIQTFDSLEGHEAQVLLDANRVLQITYGYVSAAAAKGAVNVPEVLAASLRRNATGSVVVSTSKIERLHQYAEIVAAVDSER